MFKQVSKKRETERGEREERERGERENLIYSDEHGKLHRKQE